MSFLYKSKQVNQLIFSIASYEYYKFKKSLLDVFKSDLLRLSLELNIFHFNIKQILNLFLYFHYIFFVAISDIDSDGLPSVCLYDTSTDKDVNINELMNKLDFCSPEQQEEKEEKG